MKFSGSITTYNPIFYFFDKYIEITPKNSERSIINIIKFSEAKSIAILQPTRKIVTTYPMYWFIKIPKPPKIIPVFNVNLANVKFWVSPSRIRATSYDSTPRLNKPQIVIIAPKIFRFKSISSELLSRNLTWF